mgnify:CR=1 FL=1
MLVLTAGVVADRKRYRHVTSKLRSPPHLLHRKIDTFVEAKGPA